MKSVKLFLAVGLAAAIGASANAMNRKAEPSVEEGVIELDRAVLSENLELEEDEGLEGLERLEDIERIEVLEDGEASES